MDELREILIQERSDSRNIASEAIAAIDQNEREIEELRLEIQLRKIYLFWELTEALGMNLQQKRQFGNLAWNNRSSLFMGYTRMDSAIIEMLRNMTIKAKRNIGSLFIIRNYEIIINIDLLTNIVVDYIIQKDLASEGLILLDDILYRVLSAHKSNCIYKVKNSHHIRVINFDVIFR